MDSVRARIAFDPQATRGARLDPIPFPAGYAPTFAPVVGVQDTDPLPRGDVLVVTYTVAEGQALSDVLTPGHSSSEWTSYRNDWGALKPLVGPNGPSRESDRAGLWATTGIGDAVAVLVKSDLHPATDGPKLPMVALWQQMISQVRPSLVITTGTAGGVGPDVQLGDVVATSSVKWDANTKFASESWAHQEYDSAAGLHVLGTAPVQAFLGTAQQDLMPVNGSRIPRTSGSPQVFTNVSGPCGLVTTDFFAFDTADDHFELRSYDPSAHVVDMDDAALGLAVASMPTPAPWISVRNASDPAEISGPNLKAEDRTAANIYRRYGYLTTSCSALACWGIIAGLVG